MVCGLWWALSRIETGCWCTPYEVSPQVLATSLKVVSTAQPCFKCVGRLALLLLPIVGPGKLGAQRGRRDGACQ